MRGISRCKRKVAHPKTTSDTASGSVILDASCTTSSSASIRTLQLAKPSSSAAVKVLHRVQQIKQC